MLQKKFKIESPMSPKGDQPRAIEQLVDGVNKGLHHQVLLGATGTGKSLTAQMPVLVFQKRGARYLPLLKPIGEIVDHFLKEAAHVSFVNDTELADASLCPEELYVLSFNPKKGGSELKKILQYQRHAAPAHLFHVKTTCGREVEVTGDHNFFVLRNGRIQLLETEELCPDDHIPLPLETETSGELTSPLESVSLAPYLQGKSVYARVRDFTMQMEQDLGRAVTQKNLALALGKPAWAKYHQIVNQNERVSLDVFMKWKEFTQTQTVRLGTKLSAVELPLQLPLEDALLQFLGLYIAEGFSSDRYVGASVREEEMKAICNRFAETYGWSHSYRPSGDFILFESLLVFLLDSWCGKGAFQKHLPDFWTKLSLKQLSTLLSAYFSGDGWVDKNAVCTVTASRDLANELLYALSRYGICGRVKKRFQRATNATSPGNWYYQITISGRDQLERFAGSIGFCLTRKQEALQKMLEKIPVANTNVDLAPGAGIFFKALREMHGLTQKELAHWAGLSRSQMGFIEEEKRHISRVALARFLAAWPLQKGDTYEALALLAKTRWSPIQSLEKYATDEPFVYDFSVEDNETFLAGFGGMFVHNTFTIANVVERTQKPTLVLVHNKTLAAQICSELREIFPDNAVSYFVSYYDYYQPEAYMAASDTYIEKDAQINEEIDKYRHRATMNLLTRQDTIVVASVSCIYGLGSPKAYLDLRIVLKKGDRIKRDALLRQLTDLQYARAAMDFKQSMFHVLGDTVEIFPPGGDTAVRLEFWDEEIEKITEVEPFTGELLGEMEEITIFPAKHNVTTEERIKEAVVAIRIDLDARIQELQSIGKMLEAERLRTRTEYDIEILLETGYVSGIENYVRYFNDLAEGGRPATLLDYFPDDFLMVIDESHMTVPQIGAMHNGNLSRKQSLVEHGFRLPSAYDNRPLKFEEFEKYMHNVIYVSATPSVYEMGHKEALVEQVIRPTGLIDPAISIRKKEGQIDDLLEEIQKRITKGDRILVTTLTKRSAEDLTEYLTDAGIKVRYLHSDVETLDRIAILRDLRLGLFDVLVGINLLREGLDLPEVSLVAILDADKEGFLRSTSALIQTMGRAARNVDGTVIMYADKMTAAMESAIGETDRRRAIQVAYNEEHGITPQTIRKAIQDIESHRKEEEKKQVRRYDSKKVPKEELFRLVESLEVEMDLAAQNMEFEKAAVLRDEIEELRGKL